MESAKLPMWCIITAYHVKRFVNMIDFRYVYASYQAFLTEHYLGIVMEFVGGGDMFEYVVKKNGLREEEARCVRGGREGVELVLFQEHWKFFSAQVTLSSCLKLVSFFLTCGQVVLSTAYYCVRLLSPHGRFVILYYVS